MERWVKNGTENYIYYYYDESGVCGMNYNGTEYYYRKNIFGDVLAIYDSLGNLQCKYVYDAWGNHRVYNASGSEIGAEVINIGNINSIRYRGYYWDKEFNLYYLQSRYYDPTLGRFVSADGISYLDPESIVGFNLYAYCGNNPVMNTDPSGHFAISAIIISAVIGFVTTGIKDYVNDGKLFNGDISGWEYFGSTLGGAVGGLGAGLGTTILASGVGNIIEAAFVGDISSFGDVMTQFALGGLLGGVGYGISKGITSIFADKKIFGILGNLNDNTKVNKRLAKAGFGHLKIGKHGLYAVYNEMYEAYGFDTMKDAISNGYDFVIGLAF